MSMSYGKREVGHNVLQSELSMHTSGERCGMVYNALFLCGRTWYRSIALQVPCMGIPHLRDSICSQESISAVAIYCNRCGLFRRFKDKATETVGIDFNGMQRYRTYASRSTEDHLAPPQKDRDGDVHLPLHSSGLLARLPNES